MQFSVHDEAFKSHCNSGSEPFLEQTLLLYKYYLTFWKHKINLYNYYGNLLI